jgi:hypothetical protein
MFFTLAIKNSNHPLVPPLVIHTHPVTGDRMTLDIARYLARGFIEEFIKNNNLHGSAVWKARSEVDDLEPNHFVSLDSLTIELRTKVLYDA